MRPTIPVFALAVVLCLPAFSTEVRSDPALPVLFNPDDVPAMLQQLLDQLNSFSPAPCDDPPVECTQPDPTGPIRDFVLCVLAVIMGTPPPEGCLILGTVCLDFVGDGIGSLVPEFRSGRLRFASVGWDPNLTFGHTVVWISTGVGC